MQIGKAYIKKILNRYDNKDLYYFPGMKMSRLYRP